MKLAGKKAIPLQVMTYACETNPKHCDDDNLAVMLQDRRETKKDVAGADAQREQSLKP